ncbi:MAG: hypothetical protein SGJ17_04650 [Hyphomicrobiales bacterium]|nr:hypothetical protein [Hyphomicrobiales bacterium]
MASARESGAGKTVTPGECCETMRGILASDDFEPLFSLEDDGAIYITVGLGETEEDGAGLMDHVMSYCPFCGAKQPEPREGETEVKSL